MTSLTGRVVKSTDAEWDSARRGFSAWADYDGHLPEAIVFCQSADDVSNAVRWARVNGKPLRARCGRHSYHAVSSLVKGGIVIDVSDIDFVNISPDKKTATCGAGIAVFELSEALNEVGVTIPLATGKTVGIAGFTLGGGFGLTSRKWGLTCDSLISVEIVLADGSCVHASAVEHPDLFWACCGGGGGNFGIVTAFTFMVHPVSNVVLFSIRYPWSAFYPVVNQFQQWIDSVDDGVTAFLTLLATQTIELQGQFTADDSELVRIETILKPMLFETMKPLSTSIKKLRHKCASRVVFGLDPIMPKWRSTADVEHQIFKSSSAFIYELLPPTAIELLKHNLESAPSLSAEPSQPSMVQLLGGGGAAARRDTDATAAYHRKARYIVQYDAYWTAPQDSQATIAWIDSFRKQMSPYTEGAYVNYIDFLLENPLEQYYGPNLVKLTEIKRTYDPDNLFNAPQSIPLSIIGGSNGPG